MDSVPNPTKPHYDITMSRRTRKAHSRALFGEKVNALKDDDEENEEDKRKKQFIEILCEKEEDAECRSSLGERFTEEDKELQLVVKQHETGLDGVSLKQMVRQCAKVWGRLIKGKAGARKKRVLHLTM